MSKLLHVSTSPHVLSKDSTHSIMLDVVLALIPAAAWGVYMFGYRAAIILALSMISAVACEYIWQKCMHLPITVNDYSALVTGLLLGMNLPSTVPYWLPVVGSAFAIIIVKQLFGGIGQNFMNPALAGRCFLLIAFAGLMTNFPSVDAVSTATPLAVLKNGGTQSLSDMFFGFTSGTIGEVSALLLLAGGILPSGEEGNHLGDPGDLHWRIRSLHDSLRWSRFRCELCTVRDLRRRTDAGRVLHGNGLRIQPDYL